MPEYFPSGSKGFRISTPAGILRFGSLTNAKAARAALLGKNSMSIEFPAALVHDVAETAAGAQPAASQWTETAVAVVFAASAVLFVSFIAVMTALT